MWTLGCSTRADITLMLLLPTTVVGIVLAYIIFRPDLKTAEIIYWSVLVTWCFDLTIQWILAPYEQHKQRFVGRREVLQELLRIKPEMLEHAIRKKCTEPYRSSDSDEYVVFGLQEEIAVLEEMRAFVKCLRKMDPDIIHGFLTWFDLDWDDGIDEVTKNWRSSPRLRMLYPWEKFPSSTGLGYDGFGVEKQSDGIQEPYGEV